VSTVNSNVRFEQEVRVSLTEESLIRVVLDTASTPGVGTLAALYTDPVAGRFILVRGGSFDMGCTGEQSGCADDEKPVRRVTLSDYYMGETEVTQAQWRAVMGSDPRGLEFKGCDACPVEGVSWDDVQAFISRLNSRSGGKRYRLPTEAEWEYAARGGSLSKGYRYSGSNNLDEVGWYGNNSGIKTRPVKGRKPNELGLYDMSGNVNEWCSDCYGSYASGAQSNPLGPSGDWSRVDRGGSFYSDAGGCRVAYRHNRYHDNTTENLGFRLVLVP
jgi:formylglycine-generating enzyme required for sulfatase activity